MVALPSSKEPSIRKDLSLVLGSPKLAARVPAFLKNRRKDVLSMLDALTRGEFETVERLGHSMNGSGASFGFQTITDIGAALEREARSADTNASRKWVGELSKYLESVGLLKSEGLKHGSLQTFPADIREVSAEARANDTPTAREARRIVLVDDNDDLRGVFRDVLEHCGHHVKEARNGVEGVALIIAERPEVAIIDIGLLGMDGYEIARQVRAALGHSVRLVAMTGHGSESDRGHALAAGFDLHMTKPIDIATVERMLETLPARAA